MEGGARGGAQPARRGAAPPPAPLRSAPAVGAGEGGGGGAAGSRRPPGPGPASLWPGRSGTGSSARSSSGTSATSECRTSKVNQHPRRNPSLRPRPLLRPLLLPRRSFLPSRRPRAACAGSRSSAERGRCGCRAGGGGRRGQSFPRTRLLPVRPRRSRRWDRERPRGRDGARGLRRAGDAAGAALSCLPGRCCRPQPPPRAVGAGVRAPAGLGGDLGGSGARPVAGSPRGPAGAPRLRAQPARRSPATSGVTRPRSGHRSGAAPPRFEAKPLSEDSN